MKRHRLYFMAWAALLAGWLGYMLAGGWFAQLVAAQIGGILSRIGQGKFNDPAAFLQYRLREGLWLVTLVLIWIAAHSVLERVLRSRTWGRRWRWVAQGIAGFVLLNVWIAFAAKTALFWAVLGAGAGIQNYMQFQFKRIVAAEIQTPMRAVLMGSSQTRTQIDEGLLNERLGQKLWTTELHFPGSKAYDLLLLEPQLAHVQPQLVLCYFTESYLYVGSESETPPNFFTFSRLPDAWRRNALQYLSKEEIGYGLLGDILPLFRCRNILSQRLLGEEIANLKQAEYDAGLASDLDERAKESAELYRLNAESDFQKRALEDFVARCAKANRRVVLLTGGFNPFLARRMNPAVREDMLRFLDDLQSRHHNLTVIPASDLPEQTAADYVDLSHVNRDMQRRFTAHLATLLAKQMELNR